MNILIGGGTGFIGKSLTQHLESKGHNVKVLTRNPSSAGRRAVYWNPPAEFPNIQTLEWADAVINLAGEPVVGKRWSRSQKRKILESRCESTQLLVKTISKLSKKPRVLINASAVGYYGSENGTPMTEESPVGKDFLAGVCKAWEAHAIRAQDFGLRVVRARVGIVLHPSGGVLAKMLPAFRRGLGGPLGDGKQWMSWIHLNDAVKLIEFALTNENVTGPLNLTAPEPVTMNDFVAMLSKAVKKPARFRVPALVLKLALGEMSSMLLRGQKVLPDKAIALGYKFQFRDLPEAFRHTAGR